MAQVAQTQELSVQPVNIFLAPGQKATSLSVTNTGKSETGIQIRTFDWNQKGDDDQLVASQIVVASPPLITIAPGSTQVVRLILRQAPRDQEATYRILLDQLPPPPEAGVVRVVLRMSIPIFAMPVARAAPRLRFHVEPVSGGGIDLVGVNDGLSHEALRDIVLTTGDGHQLKAAAKGSPYILAGSTRHWHIDAQGYVPRTNENLQLTAHGYVAPFNETVHMAAVP
jgi:fimbrial chaperone protein